MRAKSAPSRLRRVLLKLCLAAACFVLGAMGSAYFGPAAPHAATMQLAQ